MSPFMYVLATSCLSRSVYKFSSLPLLVITLVKNVQVIGMQPVKVVILFLLISNCVKVWPCQQKCWLKKVYMILSKFVEIAPPFSNMINHG